MARDDAAVARVHKALDSLSKAWPVLAKHADHIDGEFANALDVVKAAVLEHYPAPRKARAEVKLCSGTVTAVFDPEGVDLFLGEATAGRLAVGLTRADLKTLTALDARADEDGMVDAEEETLHEVLDDLRAIDGAAWVPGALTEMAEEGLGAAAPKNERQAGEVSSTPVATPRDHSDSPAPSPTPAPLGVIDGDSLPPGGLDRALREAHEASEQSAPAPNGDGRLWWAKMLANGWSSGELYASEQLATAIAPQGHPVIPVVPRSELVRMQQALAQAEQALLVSREARHRLREAWEQEHALRVLGRADHTRADSAHARPEPMAHAGANGEPTPQLTQVEDERHQLRFDLQRVQAEREEAYDHARRQHEQLAAILGRDDALPVLAARMKQELGEAEAKLAAATKPADSQTRERLWDAVASLAHGGSVSEVVDRVLFIIGRESEE